MRTKLVTVLALMFALALTARLTFESRYIDASGATCVAFAIGVHEVDGCYGRQDR